MRAFPVRARGTLGRVVDAVAEATVVVGFTRAGIELRRRLGNWDDPPAMRGQVVVVTGASSGIGLAAAVAMARLGASVHLVGRDPERAARALAAVAAAGAAHVGLDLVDLTDPDAVAALALRLIERYEHLNVLVHSAGALSRDRKTTKTGTEVTVATQVLAPYVLTASLAPILWQSSPASIVTVSSGGMYTQRFDLDALEMAPEDYDGTVAYARCKRAQVVLAKAWAQRFGPAGVASYSMHPGWANTPGLKDGLPRFAAVMRPLLRTPGEGADTVVWLAAGGARTPACSGRLRPLGSGFFHDRRERPDHRFPFSSPSAPGEEEALLSWCAHRTGIATPFPPSTLA